MFSILFVCFMFFSGGYFVFEKRLLSLRTKAVLELFVFLLPPPELMGEVGFCFLAFYCIPQFVYLLCHFCRPPKLIEVFSCDKEGCRETW